MEKHLIVCELHGYYYTDKRSNYKTCKQPNDVAQWKRHQSPGSACQQTSFSARRPGMTSRKTWHQQNHWSRFVAWHTCWGSLFPSTCWMINWLNAVHLAVVPLLRSPKNDWLNWLDASMVMTPLRWTLLHYKTTERLIYWLLISAYQQIFFFDRQSPRTATPIEHVYDHIVLACSASYW